MDTLVGFCFVAVAFTGLTAGSGVLPDGPLAAAVGGSVRFDTTLDLTATPILTSSWIFYNVSDIEIKVITVTPAANNTGPAYDGRITFFMQSGSLELSKLTLNDSGEYRLQITTVDATLFTGSTTLQTLVPVSDVNVKVNSTDLVEFNSTVRLSCASLGTSASFHWMNGSGEISASDRVQLSDGGATLTVAPVTRYDQNSFRCRVSNLVSEDTSESVLLSVNYGPDDTKLDFSPQQEYIAEGSNVFLSCSADSKPAAMFNWFVDGKDLSISESQLPLINIQQSKSGNYNCQSFNNKTLRYKESQQLPIKVLKKISGTSVTPSMGHPIEGLPLDITCEATGSVFFRQWTKGGSVLVPDERVTLHNENRTLSFRAATRSDSGPYSCRVINPIDQEEGTVSVLVNYGPDPAQITGPSQISVRRTLTLTCSAASVPSATYTWTLLNHTEALHNSSTFVKDNVNILDSGSYVCSAMNHITEKSKYAVHKLAVTDEPVDPCPAGCIAAIVVSCFIVCAAAAGGGYAFYRKRNKPKNRSDSNNSDKTGGKGHDNTAETKDQELNYADLSDLHPKDGARVQPELEDGQTVYAEVRVNNGPPSYNAHIRRMKRQAPLEANKGQFRPQVHSNESFRGSADQSTV
ncbi:cell adhesion molecule CEACAM5-like [Vanacampus margaritifer]